MSSQLLTSNRNIWEYAQNGDVNGLMDLIQAAEGKLDVDADRDPVGSTALICAARGGHLNCLAALLSSGAQVDIKNKNDSISLLWAAGNGHVNCVNTLLSAGAQVD